MLSRRFLTPLPLIMEYCNMFGCKHKYWLMMSVFLLSGCAIRAEAGLSTSYGLYVGKSTIGTVSSSRSSLASGCAISFVIGKFRYRISNVSHLNQCTTSGYIFLYRKGKGFTACIHGSHIRCYPAQQIGNLIQ